MSSTTHSSSTSLHGSNPSSLIDEYYIILDCVLDRPDMRPVFRDFLSTINNEAPFVFFEAVEKYQLMRNEVNRYHYAQNLVEKYIESDKGVNQLNLSSTMRHVTVQKFREHCSVTHCPRDLFDAVQLEMIIELRDDCFTNFVKSATLRHFIDQKGNQAKQYLDLIGRKKSEISDDELARLRNNDGRNRSDSMSSLSYRRSWSVDELIHCCNNPDMFTHPNFTQSDIDVIQTLITSQDQKLWKPTVHNDQQSNYISAKPFYHKNRGIKMIKEVIVVPYSADEVFHLLADDNYTNLLEPHSEMKHVNYIPTSNNNPFAISLNHVTIRAPLFFADREMLVATSATKEGQSNSSSYLLIKRSCESSDISNSFHTIANYFGGVSIENISDRMCRVVIVSRLDLQGKTPKGIINYFLSARGFHTSERLMQCLMDRRNKGLKKPENSKNKIIDTLLANSDLVDNNKIVVNV